MPFSSKDLDPLLLLKLYLPPFYTNTSVCVSKDLQGKNIEGGVQFLKLKFVSHLGVLVMLDVQDRILVAWFKLQGDVVQKKDNVSEEGLYDKNDQIPCYHFVNSFDDEQLMGLLLFLVLFMDHSSSFKLTQVVCSCAETWYIHLRSGYLGCKKKTTLLLTDFNHFFSPIKRFRIQSQIPLIYLI